MVGGFYFILYMFFVVIDDAINRKVIELYIIAS